MDIIIVLIVCVSVIAVATLLFLNKDQKSLDINNDQKVDLQDVKAAVDNAVDQVKEAADVNKDGEVDSKDVAVAVQAVKEAVKKEVKKTVNRATNKATKPPASSKPAAKSVVNADKPVSKKRNFDKKA